MTSQDVNFDKRTKDDDRHMSHDLRKLSQAPLSIMNGWVDLWQGYAQATHATYNLFGNMIGRATDDLTQTMTAMRRDIRNIEDQR